MCNPSTLCGNYISWFSAYKLSQSRLNRLQLWTLYRVRLAFFVMHNIWPRYHTIASDPTVTGSIYKRSFSLFFWQFTSYISMHCRFTVGFSNKFFYPRIKYELKYFIKIFKITMTYVVNPRCLRLISLASGRTFRDNMLWGAGSGELVQTPCVVTVFRHRSMFKFTKLFNETLCN